MLSWLQSQLPNISHLLNLEYKLEKTTDTRSLVQIEKFTKGFSLPSRAYECSCSEDSEMKRKRIRWEKTREKKRGEREENEAERHWRLV